MKFKEYIIIKFGLTCFDAHGNEMYTKNFFSSKYSPLEIRQIIKRNNQLIGHLQYQLTEVVEVQNTYINFDNCKHFLTI